MDRQKILILDAMCKRYGQRPSSIFFEDKEASVMEKQMLDMMVLFTAIKNEEDQMKKARQKMKLRRGH